MKNKFLSQNRINRIKAQGYQGYSDSVINDLAFGNRFAYQVCTSILIIGVVLGNLTILSVMMGVAFSAVILPNHPFDYIYNYFLAKRMGKPQLPRRSKQLKFGCILATIWIGVTLYLTNAGIKNAAFVVGYTLLIPPFLVSTTDFCIPSMIYNATEKFFSRNTSSSIKASNRP